jgi:hypothetical protein
MTDLRRLTLALRQIDPVGRRSSTVPQAQSNCSGETGTAAFRGGLGRAAGGDPGRALQRPPPIKGASSASRVAGRLPIQSQAPDSGLASRENERAGQRSLSDSLRFRDESSAHPVTQLGAHGNPLKSQAPFLVARSRATTDQAVRYISPRRQRARVFCRAAAPRRR